MKDIFDFEAKTDLYAVFGNPISHSKSPLIHTAFAEQLGQKINYEAIHVDLGGFSQAVRNFQANDGQGLNITVPFKMEAYQFADELSDRAASAGAVNTFKFTPEGNILGDNTDGIGLVNDITKVLDWEIHNKKILILGSGGATRGILQPLLQAQPDLIHIANRTASKAIQLADDFSHLGNLWGSGFAKLNGSYFDIVINATSASLSGELPEIDTSVIAEANNCYDLMYSTEDTEFIHWAKSLGVPNTSDGLGMLVGQAAESFYLWRGVRPDCKSVLATLRKAMQ